jgi:fructose-specific phosphotransferase system IIC component
MIEITNEPAFRPGYHTQWHCSRCNQPVPDERHYDVDGVHGVLRSSDLVYGAAIAARISTCRVIISVLVGSLTVGSVDRMPGLHLATPFDDAVMNVIRGSICLFLYGIGAVLLGMLVDKTLDWCGAYRVRRGE